MIRLFKHLKLWRADYVLRGEKITVIAPKKNEAWRELIEIVAIEAKNLRGT